MTEIALRRIAMVGFGEAGSILGAELAASGREVVTYDILLDTPVSRGPLLEKARLARVQTADSLNAAVKDADHAVGYHSGRMAISCRRMSASPSCLNWPITQSCVMRS